MEKGAKKEITFFQCAENPFNVKQYVYVYVRCFYWGKKNQTNQQKKHNLISIIKKTTTLWTNSNPMEKTVCYLSVFIV